MTVAVFVVLGLLALLFLIILFKYVGLYVQALLAKAEVGLLEMVAMSLRKVPPALIVKAKIMAVQAGLPLQTRDVEAHYLAGGNVLNVVRSLIAAHRAGLALDFKMGTGIDLAGRNVLEAIQTSVNPKVIDCPDPAKTREGTIAAVAKDGIQLLTRARVTVRTNLPQLVGGATEETIIARVGEGIVASIGMAQSYKDVLEAPDRISKAVLTRGLDAGTAFEILSIDIADINVGENVGAKLQADQAEANKRMAQAQAEVRRAMAVAQEQEMQARVMENRAKVVENEAQVPLAMAEAFRSGRLGVMDYYRFKNIQADTDMRSAIAGHDVAGGGEPSA
ncbi:MAG: flotillin-like protein FloA [Planctomycetes bacterium]|nr:flotillin-like protein FloA [Planctomycetota bacterium]